MGEAYSPLRYPGGKAKLAPFIIELIQSNGLDTTHYVEPYAGGAGAALALLFEEYVDEITINDADPRVYAFWQAIKMFNEDFIHCILSVRPSVEEWRKQRQIYCECDISNILHLGFATFFLNRTTRSGIIHNGGPIGGYNQMGNFKIDARFCKKTLVRRIERIGIYADRINVSGIDGLKLVRDLSISTKRTSTFVYLDPPYYSKGDELYFNKFTDQQHRDLAECLRTRDEFPWILTYDNVEAISELYQSLPKLTFNLSYSAYSRRSGQEILIYPKFLSLPDKTKQALSVSNSKS